MKPMQLILKVSISLVCIEKLPSKSDVVPKWDNSLKIWACGIGVRLSAETIYPFIVKYLFCADNEMQQKKMIPIMIRRFIFLRQQDYKTTRLQVFWGNVEGRFLLFLKLRLLAIGFWSSELQKKSARYLRSVEDCSDEVMKWWSDGVEKIREILEIRGGFKDSWR